MTKTFVLAIFASASLSVYAQTDTIPAIPDTLNLQVDTLQKKEDGAWQKTTPFKQENILIAKKNNTSADAITKAEAVVTRKKYKAQVSA